MKIAMKKTVTFLLLLFVANGYSQVFAPKWESCFGGTEWDEGTGIIYSDSSYWIAGRTESADGDIARSEEHTSELQSH